MHSARYAFVAEVEYSEGTFVMASSSASRMTSTSSGSKCGMSKNPDGHLRRSHFARLSWTRRHDLHGSSRSVSRCANVRDPATLQMSFHRDRMTLIAAVGRLLEDDEQRDHSERRDHQQFVIVDVGDDLRLLRDHGVECGASGGCKRIPELCDGWIGEDSVHGGDVLHDFGVVHLRVARQQSVNYRDADTGADVARPP